MRIARLGTAVVALTLAAGLAGCSVSPGAAAVVDGRTIGQAEVAATFDDLAPLLSDAQPKTVVQALIVAPYVIAAAEDNGVGASAAEGVALLRQVAEATGAPVRSTYSDGAVQIARSEVSGQNLAALPDGQSIMAGVTETIAAREIQVNPQYGAFSAESLSVQAIAWPWIATAAG
ncbi:MAG TPA: hypothetical protein PKB06_06085 [Actinotalea sp.]|nr:hypothetical protein [Actinotalea sp.]